jgi:hypothetical protein
MRKYKTYRIDGKRCKKPTIGELEKLMDKHGWDNVRILQNGHIETGPFRAEIRRPVLPAKAKVMPMPKFIEGQIEDAFQRFWIQQQGGQTYYSSFVAGYKAGWNRLRRYMARGK